jgi:hypothetical protein
MNLRKFFGLTFTKHILIMADEVNQNKGMLKRKRIKIAHHLLSLDDIEHGILRIHKYKIGFCYLNNPFYPAFIKRLAIEKVDHELNLVTIKKMLNSCQNKNLGIQMM